MYCGLTDITIWIFSIYQYIIKKSVMFALFKYYIHIQRQCDDKSFCKDISCKDYDFFLSLSFLRNKNFLNWLMFIPFSDFQLHCKTRRVTHLISSDSSFDLTHLCFNVAKEMHTLQNELFKDLWKDMWTALKKIWFCKWSVQTFSGNLARFFIYHAIPYMSIHQHATGTVQSLPR